MKILGLGDDIRSLNRVLDPKIRFGTDWSTPSILHVCHAYSKRIIATIWLSTPIVLKMYAPRTDPPTSTPYVHSCTPRVPDETLVSPIFRRP